ncbi:hypothetical protein Taro_045373 [Colocasia esculenta]|uniref:Uncharacterized protein n=1 Tax=Colocasia esculenta TaxID=4460 RepID=A0A843WWW2_COLES|nr:hypothetical protein [Colocasia esculenta]
MSACTPRVVHGAEPNRAFRSSARPGGEMLRLLWIIRHSDVVFDVLSMPGHRVEWGKHRAMRSFRVLREGVVVWLVSTVLWLVVMERQLDLTSVAMRLRGGEVELCFVEVMRLGDQLMSKALWGLRFLSVVFGFGWSPTGPWLFGSAFTGFGVVLKTNVRSLGLGSGHVLNAKALVVAFWLLLLGSTFACVPRVVHGAELADGGSGKATP